MASNPWSNNSMDLPPPPPPPVISAPSSSSDSMDSSKDEDGEDNMEINPNNWYFDKERLENTPSRKLGIDADRELMYRQQSANFIQDMGQRLQVNQLCINTAIVYMHRFYMYHSFSVFSRNNVSTASIFLAAKVEEQPRKLEYVIKVAHYCLHRESIPSIDTKSEAYANQCTDLVNTENILLQTLGFDVGIDHPHTHVVKCCQLVRASKDLAQTSYFMATNSLHLTTMCMQYRPSVVACVCIHLACKWSNWEIPRSKEGRDWYWYVDDTVTAEQLEALTTEFLTIFNKSPSRLKKKIISLSAATSGSGGMNMSNFPSHFNFDQFNKQASSSSSAPTSSSSTSTTAAAGSAAKPKVLPPYSKPGQPQIPSAQVPPQQSSTAGIPPLLGKPIRPLMSGPAREPTGQGQMKPSGPQHHQSGPPTNKHGMQQQQQASAPRPIPVHQSGTYTGSHSGSSSGSGREGAPHSNRPPHPPPAPIISQHSSSSGYSQYHGSSRPPSNVVPVPSTGAPGPNSGNSNSSQSQNHHPGSGISNSQSQSHHSNQSSMNQSGGHNQPHPPQGQRGQGQGMPNQPGQGQGHPPSSQQQHQRQHPGTTAPGLPHRPLLPTSSLSMKQPHGGLMSGSGNRPPGQPHQQPLVSQHSGQMKRPYPTDMNRTENSRAEMKPNLAKRECLPGDVRRPMPAPPPPPTMAQMQAKTTQAIVREKSEKMNAVQMAMLKKPHDLLSSWGSNVKPSVPELPTHSLLQKQQQQESSHHQPPIVPVAQPFKMDYQATHEKLRAEGTFNNLSQPPPSQPKHDPFSSHSNHGSNNSQSGTGNSSSSSYAPNPLFPKNEFSFPIRPLSPIKNEYPSSAPVSSGSATATSNSNAYNNSSGGPPPVIKSEPMHNSGAAAPKDIRKNEYAPNSFHPQSMHIKSEPSAQPPQLYPAPAPGSGGGVLPRNDFSSSLSLKHIVKKEPQQQHQLVSHAQTEQLKMPTMPKLEPAPTTNSSSSLGANNSNSTKDDDSYGGLHFTTIDNDFLNMGDLSVFSVTQEFGSQGTEQSSTPSKKKKKKDKKEHKHKDKHRDKDEKKSKDKSEKKHKDEDKKKHRDKDEKREEKKHKDKEEKRKHKKDKHKDKSSPDKHGKSKHSISAMITPPDDSPGSSKIKILIGRGGGDNSNSSGKSSKKQHPTASVVYYTSKPTN